MRTERGVVRADNRPIPATETRADFESFYRTNYGAVKGFLLKGGADRTEAEDATQNAMAALLERWQGVHSHASWVRTTARNDWLKAKVRERETPCLDMPDGPSPMQSAHLYAATPEEHLHQAFQQSATVRILHVLPPTQRTCFALVVDGYTTQEIARITGKSPAVVRSNIAHARRRLRHVFDSHDWPRTGSDEGE